MKRQQEGTILIIDNDEHVVRLTSMLLERHGYSIIAAHDGLQGVREFNDGHVDLVITDLNMPKSDGLTLIREIRQKSNVPIIILTGFSKDYADEVRYVRNVTTLTKPYSTESLLDLVDLELAASCPTG